MSDVRWKWGCGGPGSLGPVGGCLESLCVCLGLQVPPPLSHNKEVAPPSDYMQGPWQRVLASWLGPNM